MSNSIFDFDALCDRVAGRLDIVDELIQLLRTSFPNDRRELIELLETNNAAAAREVAHRVKGQLQTLGLNRAADQARCIEYLARDGRVAEALATIADLDREFQRFEDNERSRVSAG